MRSAIIRQELRAKDTSNIRQNLFKLSSHKKLVVRYDCLPTQATQYPTSGLGIEEGKRVDHVWSCVGPHALPKFISLEPFMV